MKFKRIRKRNGFSYGFRHEGVVGAAWQVTKIGGHGASALEWIAYYSGQSARAGTRIGAVSKVIST